jgi:hypothetical protein
MFWDDLVRRLRRDARAVSPALLRAAGGHVAVLPAPRPSRMSRLALTLLLVLVLGLGLWMSSGHFPLGPGVAPTPASSALMA